MSGLLRLERDTLISRNGDLYFFLTNEERDINKEIKDQDYSQTDLHRLLGEVIFEDVLKDLRRYRFAGNGKDFDLARLIDLAPVGNRNEGSLTLSVLTPLAPDFASFTDPRCLEMSVEGQVGALVIKLRDDQKLAEEIKTYIQTQNYLKLKTDGALPLTTKRIHDDKRQENTQRRNRINAMLTQMLEEAKFFILGNEKSFTGGPKAAVEAGLRYLVENSYNKLSYVQHSPSDHMAEIRRLLADPTGEELDLLGGSQNSKALKDVLEYIDLLSGRSQSVNLGALINERFTRHPYGWKEHDILLLVCRLFKAGQIELHANGGKLQAGDVFGQIDGSNKWNRVSLSRRKTVDRADIQAVRTLARDLFGIAAPEGEDDLHGWLRTRFDGQSRNLGQWSALATTGNYPGTDDIADIQGILNKLLANQDSYAFLEHVKAHGDDLVDAGDRYQRLETFYTQQRPQWDALRSAYRNEFEPNALFLGRDAEAAAALATVRAILHDPKPYGRIKESAPLIATLRAVTGVELPVLDRDEIVNLKLDGTKDEQIYRKLLIAQCNDLHRAMPFLFEKIDDETELLLPENLLQSDSIVRKLVNEIAEEDWQEIEIIGWLYQFYISEKKDQVIGKVVKSEDIPAATQLFTPNWIVKYMVQNSLGAQWLATYPDSEIRSNYPMDYYIAPAEQTPEVQAQIDAITPKQLDPEAITLIDPAVGSGHILVEAYDLFRAIYLERGYTKREAARAILTKNLFGLDIDDRAAQMAGFALLMKACADDRTVLRNPPKLNVLALQDSEGLDADALAKALLPQERFEMVPSGDLLPETLAQPTLAAQQPMSSEAKAIKGLVALVGGAKTFGSLITVPEPVMQSLPLLDALLAKPLTGDLYQRQAQEDAQETLKPLVEQARLLGGQYDCVVANPPYLGMASANPMLKSFLKKNYDEGKIDLYSAFMQRCEYMSSNRFSMITQHSWMFLSRFEGLRKFMMDRSRFESFLHLGPRTFEEIGGEVVQSSAFSFQINNNPNFKSVFIDLRSPSYDDKRRAFLQKNCTYYIKSMGDFGKLPSNIMAYWSDERDINVFSKSDRLRDYSSPRHGMVTSDNQRFLRQWHEVSWGKVGLGFASRKAARASNRKWFPYNKGGGNRKWYGNIEYLVNWEDDGRDIIHYAEKLYGSASRQIQNTEYYFRDGITWSSLSSHDISMRMNGVGYIFDSKGNSMFSGSAIILRGLLSLCNSSSCSHFMKMLAPTLDFNSGSVSELPVPKLDDQAIEKSAAIAEDAVSISKIDWDDRENSWSFTSHPLIEVNCKDLEESYRELRKIWMERVKLLKLIESENNDLFQSLYGLKGRVVGEASEESVTLTCNPHYRYGGGLTDEEREARLKSDTMRELVSYAVGCMMGRYSLAEPGLIYAHSGGVGFDPSRYGPFPADDDGIIPMTEEQWFADVSAVSANGTDLRL